MILYERLKTIVSYCVSVYLPMFFMIKVKHSWLEGPRHVLYELQLLRFQSPEVQNILEPTVCRSAWNSHSESVIQTLVCSENSDERKFGVDMILKIWGRKKEGDLILSPRNRKHPELKMEACKLEDMISWKQAMEPVLTCMPNKQELLDLKETLMKVPYYPVHTQVIEFNVQEVMHASDAVYGFERRDGWVRARAKNRKPMPVFSNKKDIVNLIS